MRELQQYPVEKAHGEKEPLIFTILVGSHLLALVGLIFFWSWSGLFLLCLLHTFLVVFGISLGHHRYFAHRTYSAHPWFEKFLAICSTLCFQGGPIYWSSVHRTHHAFSDGPGDPHSASLGFWWSHCGWLFYKHPNGFSVLNSRRVVRDLLSRPFLVWLEKWNLQINLFSLAVLFVVCWWFKRVDLFYWLGPIRMVTVWNAAWSTNSLLHGARFFGNRPPEIKNSLFGDIFVGGEGMHRAHHERPALVTYPGRPHFDLGYVVLLVLERLRLVNIYRPAPLPVSAPTQD